MLLMQGVRTARARRSCHVARSHLFLLVVSNVHEAHCIAGVFEYEVDAEGNTTGKTWEWT
jgi:hypothetical protein